MDNIMMDSDMLMEESLEKILELLENKKYFQARDELLKYNGVDTVSYTHLDVYKRQSWACF